MESEVLAAGIVKRVDRLSDGRELIYFDDADTRLPPVRRPDARPVAPRPETATMRLDALTGEWISIAAARQNRVVLPSVDPLAPATADNPSEIPDEYDVAVFENRSPSFGPLLAGGKEYPRELRTHELEQSYPSYGRCEVVCFDSRESGSFAEVSRSRARTIIEAWADRTAALSHLAGVQQVFPFENRGEAIGVTLHHPHGQIYGYPYVTPRTQGLLASVARYRAERGGNLFADILDREVTGPRLILSGEHWSAYVPFAARWPLEVHMMPHRHVPDFGATDEAERTELAVVYLRLLRAIDSLYDTPTPYIAAWHQAPVRVSHDDVRMSLQITSPRRGRDRLKFLAGSEAAMGAFIGDIPPERQAAALKDALMRADESRPVL